MGALPNLFDYDIASALSGDNPDPQEVARKIASSEHFIRAVRNGMKLALPIKAYGATTTAALLRGALARLCDAGTANQMFDD